MRRRTRIGAGTTGALALAVALGAWVGPLDVARVGPEPGLSVVSGGSQSALSGDGRHVAFVLAETLQVKDTRTGTTIAVCQVKDYCREPALSHDGRLIAFASGAGDLAPGGRPGKAEVFVKDLHTGGVRLVSRMPARGRQRSAHSPSMSADGSRIAFVTGYGGATQRAWIADETGRVTPIGERASRPRISADGHTVVFYSQAYEDAAPSGADGTRHIMVKDLRTGRLTSLYDRVRLGVTAEFYAIDYSKPSADGSRLAITLRSDREKTDPDWSGLYVVSLREGTVLHRLKTREGRITYGNTPELSADGNHLMFESADDNLVGRDLSRGSDVFVTDLRSGKTRKVSAPRVLRTGGSPFMPSTSARPQGISADGGAALFESHDLQWASRDSSTRSAGIYLARSEPEA